jgi:hypothetical protein
MSDGKLTNHVPPEIQEVFEEVRDTHHPSLSDCNIPFRFAEGKQTDPCKLERAKPAFREETGVDGILLLCPDWFGRNDPRQATLEDPERTCREREMERVIDAALCSVRVDDHDFSLKPKHPEAEVHLAIWMRYGWQPDSDEARVAKVAIKRHEAGLEYGEPLPSKYDAPDAGGQEAIPLDDGDSGDEDDADGDSEGEVEVEPAEEEEEAPEPSSVTETGKPVDPDNPWGAVHNSG